MDGHAFKPSARGNMDEPFFQKHDSMHFAQSYGQWSGQEDWSNCDGLIEHSHYQHPAQYEDLSRHHNVEAHDCHDHDHDHDQDHEQATEEECYDCHSPVCTEPDCAVLIECTDSACSPPPGAGCHDGMSTACAGPVDCEVIDAAFHLQTLRPSAHLDRNFCHDHVHAQIAMRDWNWNMNTGAMPHTVESCMPQNTAGFGFTDANFESLCQPDYCNFMAPQPFMPMDGCTHFGLIDNVVQAHQYYHHVTPQGLCPSMLEQASPITGTSSSRSSSIPAQQMSFAFSQESTPSSMSPYSSPNQVSNQFSGQIYPMLPPASSEPFEIPSLCEWDTGNGVYCNHKFTTKGELQAHIRDVHIAPLNKARGFICQWKDCSRADLGKQAFAQRSKLERHMQSHTGHKACICTFCGKEFSTQQTFTSHMRTHTGEKPYKCPIPGCDYAAAQASQLTMHNRTKHTKEKPLQCDFPNCGARFAESSNLSKHRKIHMPEEHCRCHLCSKTFRRQDQLKRHLKTHVRKEMGLVGMGGAGSRSGSVSLGGGGGVKVEPVLLAQGMEGVAGWGEVGVSS